ncbi:nucleotide-binding protein [Stenotrophomonas bentonitica]
MTVRLCFLSGKGGVGRTSLALAVASHLSQVGRRRVLLIDQDPQGSAIAWSALADETPFTVSRSRSQGFDIEIIDTPPKLPDSATLQDADLYIVPTALDAVSYVVFLRTVEFLKRHEKRFIVVANRVNKARAEHRERLATPELAYAVVVPERAGFSRAYASGTTIHQIKGRGVASVQFDTLSIVRKIKEEVSL